MDDKKKQNIIKLPDVVHFWKCTLCSANIQASYSENKDPNAGPAVVTMRDPSGHESRRAAFCVECTKTRYREIDQYISAKILGSTQNAVGERFLLDDRAPWRIYESERANGDGDRLRVIAWRSKENGIQSAVILVGPTSDSLLCYHFSGMSIHEFDIAMAYVRTQYIQEFGHLRCENTGRVSVVGSQFPIFRCRLPSRKSMLSIFKEKNAIRLCFGHAELFLNRKDFDTFAAFLSKTVGILQSSVGVFPIKKSNVIATCKLHNGRTVDVEVQYRRVLLRFGEFGINLEASDFIDIADVFSHASAVLEARTPSQQSFAAQELRNERYIRLGRHFAIDLEFVLSDMGWSFDMAGVE